MSLCSSITSTARQGRIVVPKGYLFHLYLFLHISVHPPSHPLSLSLKMQKSIRCHACTIAPFLGVVNKKLNIFNLKLNMQK